MNSFKIFKTVSPYLLGVCSDVKASVALEFALVATIMVPLMIGVVEIACFVRADMKLAHASWALADMVAQQNSVTPGQGGSLGDMCHGASMMMEPFDASQFSAGIADVTNHSDTGGDISVDWNDTVSCPSATVVVSLSDLAKATPEANLPKTSVVVVTAHYTYQPFFKLIIRQPVFLSETTYARSRSDQPILCLTCKAE